MSECIFKVGDHLIRTKNTSGDLPVGDVVRVTRITRGFDIEVKGYTGVYNPCNFKLHKYPNPPHKHCEVIKAYVEGADIEILSEQNLRWVEIAGYGRIGDIHTCFSNNREFRVKPQKSDKEIEIERIEYEMRKLADDLAKVKSN